MPTDIREDLAVPVLTRFTSDTLEVQFRDYLFESKKVLARNSLILALILFGVVEPAVRLWIPSDIAGLDTTLRWLLNVPATLVALAACQRQHNKARLEGLLLACLGLILLGNAVLLWSSGAEQRLYYAIASVQIALFGFFLLGLRFRPAFSCMLVCFAAPALLAFSQLFAAGPEAALQSPYLVAIMIFFGLAFAGHSLDISNRAVFMANRAREREYARRIELEQERRRWLEVGNDYLNHEVKNALLGITSSLNLMGKRNSDGSLSQYIERAQSSTQFMKRLLAEVSASTSLESTLDAATVESVDLAELLRARVDEYRAIHGPYALELQIIDPVQLRCDIDRLVQLLDKLVDNATQHGDPEHPIELLLQKSANHALIAIRNIGDALPDNVEQIFEPFASGKTRSTNSGFGLGLYIARRIAEAHGGKLVARPLTDPQGAEFIVELPLNPIAE